MFKIIITIIGFLIGAGAFMALLQVIPSIKNNTFVAIFIFILLFGAGITVSYIAWWLAIIIGVISLIFYSVKKRKPLEIKEEPNNSSSETVSNEDSAESE